MNENQESIDVTTYTCEFGSVNLDTPFAQQPSLREFLDVPTSQEGRLVSDELLKRFLAIAECVVNRELKRLQSLVEIKLGYQLWRALLPDEDNTIKPGDLIEYKWVDQNRVDVPAPPPEPPNSALPRQIIERLMKRFQEEVRCRLEPELLVGKSLYIFIYGRTASTLMEDLDQVFGRAGCGCEGRRVYPTVDGCSQTAC